MERKVSYIKERVLQIAENKGVSKESFFKNIGMTYGSFKGNQKKSALNSDAIDRIISKYADIDAEWLITGRGTMHKYSEDSKLPVAVPATSGIPFVLPTAIGGMGNDSFTLSERDVKDYYVIPKFKHKQVDFMIEVEGSSMYPKYNSGDVVACRIVAKESFIQWNKTHVIATRGQGIIIKRLKRGSTPESLCMISDNENYDPFEVPMDEITGMALVVGVIRIE